MKKLMVIAAVALAAVSVQAAAITWGSGTMFWSADGSSADKEGAKKLTSGAAQGYLYTITGTQYDTFLASLVVAGAVDTDYEVSLAKSAIAGDVGTKVAGPQNSAKAGSIAIKAGNHDEGTTLYGLLVYTTTQDDKTWYIANVATYLVGSGDGGPGNMAITMTGNTGVSTVAAKWGTEAVPEPTSALLLLLGVAGLALRRRRA